ncbi:MAG: hypothetical protein NC224_05040 [Bacteroides sp.]|nr:hypothetical protein [Bacteroides sp.]
MCREAKGREAESEIFPHGMPDWWTNYIDKGCGEPVSSPHPLSYVRSR